MSSVFIFALPRTHILRCVHVIQIHVKITARVHHVLRDDSYIIIYRRAAIRASRNTARSTYFSSSSSCCIIYMRMKLDWYADTTINKCPYAQGSVYTDGYMYVYVCS